MKYQLGEVLKKVRQSKRYTQKYIAGDQMSRATYAKIEACDMQPTVGKFMHILKKLDLSYEELTYIQNSYSLNGKDEIVHDFFKLTTSAEIEKVYAVNSKCTQYLKCHSDSVVQDIHYVCEAMTALHFEKTFDHAFPYANKVWERLSKLDNWYSIELKLINNIFFYFPLETSISIAERALKEIDRFSYIIKSNELKSSYLLNLTILLFKNNKYEEAYEYANKAIEECIKIKRFEGLSVAYTRKGLLLMKLGKPDEGTKLIHKGLSICKVLDLDSMGKAIIQEVHELVAIDLPLDQILNKDDGFSH
ncbi:Rgg/GadR/MutR family transcriptional regulator [Sporolactobacillus sp. CPB3-1]|uniref:Rgg/GadR/MutR family transcriptional regulator n=1 Tax=Sporolactobacillus mangiferae TaxID=2940498 RepID=A0ABT0M655_9BACL|nr:Rgg/GadR/MutR family transcriptional regulator [Sporolactobacillus mangiferae]MCL1630345.1 Rgg/GadR/MutR family transcriptional regulator [Sporolactobacillus mangiferae]